MKKICILLSIILCISLFTGCSNTGNVKNAEIVTIESEIFTEKEILDAIDVVKAEFVGFTGCTLTKIGYIGDEKMLDYLSDEVLDNPPYIILDCEFTTSESSGEEGFNVNETYEYGCWNWYLEKDVFGNWKIDNYGVA